MVRMRALSPFNRVLGGQMVVGNPDHSDETQRFIEVSEADAKTLEDDGLAKPAPLVEAGSSGGPKPPSRMNKDELRDLLTGAGKEVSEDATRKDMLDMIDDTVDTGGAATGGRIADNDKAAERLLEGGPETAGRGGSSTNAVVGHPDGTFEGAPEAVTVDIEAIDEDGDKDEELADDSDAAPGSGGAG